jgi:hypothetical protein
MTYYILDGKIPKEVDLMTWARWFEKAERHVADTKKGNIRVSTVFLGLDHQWGNGPPHLFETMIFGGAEEWQERCSTWEEAEATHKRACELAGIDEAK